MNGFQSTCAARQYAAASDAAPCSSKGWDEKSAERRAKEAERAFRASKGYAPDTLWYRMKKRFLGR